MLVALTCNCASAVPLVRQFLSSSNHPAPFDVPLYQGDQAKAFVRAHSFDQIIQHLTQYSSYAIILGFAEAFPDQYVWADINLPSPNQKITAKVIVEEFS